MHTTDSGVTDLRPAMDRPVTGGLMARLYLGWLRRYPTLSGSPVLLRLAAGAVPLLVIGIALVIAAVALGPYTIPVSHTFDILMDQIGLGQSTAPQTEQAIVTSIRLPRVVLALLVGSALVDQHH